VAAEESIPPADPPIDRCSARRSAVILGPMSIARPTVTRSQGAGERARRAWTVCWLRRSRGFRVEGPGGRIGTIEDVLPRDDAELPTVLGIRAGHRSDRLLFVTVDDVEAVFPREELVVVRGPKLIGTTSAA
jgi:hypothetical protein